jgi:hypothetical protein
MMLLAVMVFAAAPVSDEAWVRGWLGGRTQAPELMVGFHQQFGGSSPHAADSLSYEAATRVRRLVDAPPTRDVLAAAALRVLVDPKEQRAAVARASDLLRWLGSPRVLDELVRASRSPVPPMTRFAALEALSGYGTDETRGGFLVYGGNLAQVVFPPRPDARATTALLSALSDPTQAVRNAALEALDSFHGADVDSGLVAALADEDDAMKVKVLGLVARRQLKPAVPRVRELVGASGAAVRAKAIDAALALGDGAWLVPTLVKALDDPDDDVFLAVHRALWATQQLPGEPPDSAVLDRAQLTAGWKKRLAPR